MKAVEGMRVPSSNRNRNMRRVWTSESQEDHKDKIEAGRPGRPDGSIPLTVTSHWIFFFTEYHDLIYIFKISLRLLYGEKTIDSEESRLGD